MNRNRQRIVVAAACAVAIGVGVCLALKPRHGQHEPSYRGEPISKWFLQASTPWGASASDPETDRQAFRAMGRQAVPFLTRKLEGELPPRGLRALLYEVVPAANKSNAPPVAWQVRAAYLLGEIGPEANAAESNLIKAASTMSPVRYPARLALVKIRQEQPEQYVERLRRATNWQQWADTAIVLGEFRSRAEAAIPTLMEALQGSNRIVQAHAISTLGRIGRKPEQCIPAILPFLAARDSTLRQKAIGALEGFGADALPAKAAIESALRDVDPWVRNRAAALLRDLQSAEKANKSF